MKSLQMRLWAVPLALAASFSARAGEPGKSFGVKVVHDLAYTSSPSADSDRQKVDLYLPEGKRDFPVVLFLHGGGFKAGDRKAVATLGETFARHGIGVAAAGYRLFPEAKHPGQVQDVARAFAWLKKTVAGHGGRADRLFVGGHSAGGTLAALLATDEQYLKDEGADPKDLKGVIILSSSYRIPDARAEIFGDEASRKDASPIQHVHSGLPPFFLAFAENDNPGADKNTREFAEALKGHGVEAAVTEAKDRDHRTLLSGVKEGDPTALAALEFIRRNVGSASKPASR